MKTLRVRVVAPMASFRRPLDHNYQRTLPLPPRTTLLGVAGAALGLGTRELWSEDSPICQLRVQVLAQNTPARATDLWTLLKIISRSGKMRRSPYLREVLFNARYDLLYHAEHALLERLKQAFHAPAFPLSLGREDELICVESVEWVECTEAASPFRFYGTILPCNLRTVGARPVLHSSLAAEPVVVEQLPTRFGIDLRDTRRGLERQTYTFIPYGTKIVLDTNPWNEPIRQVNDRCFVWL